MIEVSHLTKRFGGHVALDDVSFSVKKGEIVGFLGPNGAGKSTTMNIMTGYLSPTHGTVRVDGIDVLENPQAAKQHIGYLPEVPPLYPDMTVDEYLFFVYDLKACKRRNKAAAKAASVPSKLSRSEEIERVAELARVADVRGRLIRNLSKGYRQRVGLAAALIGDPDILILDEPTAGLDPKQIAEVRDLITSLGGRHTVFLSSHILQEVQAVCDRLVIISKGRIAAVDSPANLMKNVLHTSRLLLTIKGPLNQIVSGLEAMDCVRDAQATSEAGDGTVNLSIRTNENEDIREKVFEFCSANDYPIYMMKTEEVNLEEIFLEVTESEGAK